jgi:hypothetical protein
MPKRNRNQNRNKGPKRSPMEKRAARDVKLAQRPELQAYHRAGQQATQQYQTDAQRVQDVYGALGGQLEALAAPYQQQVTDIGTQLTGQIAQLPGITTQSIGAAPPAERAAGTALSSTIGAGTLEQLAAGAARNAAYNTSAQRQAGIESAVTQRNFGVDLQNFLDDLSERRLGVIEERRPLMLQRLDELRDQKFQERMAEEQLGLQRGQLGVSRGQLDIQRGQLDLQRASLELDRMATQAAAQGDRAQAAFIRDLLNDPQALREFLRLGGGG